MIYLEQENDPIEYTEASFLSIIINEKNNDLLLDCFEKISSSDFSNSFHQTIYQILSDMVIKRNLIIDKMAIASKIKSVQYKKIFDEIISLNPPMENIKHYVEEIKNNSHLRKLKNIINDVNFKITTENNIKASSLISGIEDDLMNIVLQTKDECKTPKDILPSILEEIRNKKDKSELTTGFDELDLSLGGIDVGYHILGARPSVGKTMYMLQLARVNAERGKRVAIFSFEMNKKALTRRLISSITGIPTHRLRNGDLNIDEVKLLEKLIPQISSLPIHIFQCGGISATEMFTKSKRLKIKYPDLSLILVDYLQLIDGNDEGSRNNEISKISKTIKNMSNSLNIPIIALSQLSRALELRQDKRPILSDLRDSGSLEQDSDSVMFLYKESYHDRNITSNILEIILAKCRDGPLTTVFAKVDNNSQTLIKA